MGYRIAAVVFALLAVALVGLALYGLLTPEGVRHLVWGHAHYTLNLRWVGGWACLAVYFGACGCRHCRDRALKREPGPLDEHLFETSGLLILLGFIIVLVLLLTPSVVP